MKIKKAVQACLAREWGGVKRERMAGNGKGEEETENGNRRRKQFSFYLVENKWKPSIHIDGIPLLHGYKREFYRR